MDIAVFDTHTYDRHALEMANRKYSHRLTFLEPRLTAETAALADGFPALCSFVNDRLDRRALSTLQSGGTRLVALRSAGYNHVDLRAAADLGLPVVRVPAYSPHAVAEHAVALILTLNRKLHRAFNRVREGNFELDGNVLITSHQGFLTREALEGIATTTLENVRVFEADGRAPNEVRTDQVLR